MPSQDGVSEIRHRHGEGDEMKNREWMSACANFGYHTNTKSGEPRMSLMDANIKVAFQRGLPHQLRKSRRRERGEEMRGSQRGCPKPPSQAWPGRPSYLPSGHFADLPVKAQAHKTPAFPLRPSFFNSATSASVFLIGQPTRSKPSHRPAKSSFLVRRNSHHSRFQFFSSRSQA